MPLILYAQLKLHGAALASAPENMADWRRVVRNVIAHSASAASAENSTAPPTVKAQPVAVVAVASADKVS